MYRTFLFKAGKNKGLQPLVLDTVICIIQLPATVINFADLKSLLLHPGLCYKNQHHRFKNCSPLFSECVAMKYVARIFRIMSRTETASQY